MTASPTLLGFVGAVAGSAISVHQAPSVASGIAIIGGKTYRIGQVGSFVRIPQGYQDLYGVMSEVGAHATPEGLRDGRDRGERWMTVQLVGEIIGTTFERGISQYPNINDEVHLVTEEDLARVYGSEESGEVTIGRLANAEGIPVRVDLSKLVTRHCAVLGSTGAGKSTTVASLLRSISAGASNSETSGFPSARILVLDIHGEYGRALNDVSQVFRVTPGAGEQPLHIPYWALQPVDLLAFLLGKLDERPLTQILDKIQSAKEALAKEHHFAGIELSSLTVDTPVPYSLKQLWFDLIDPEVKTWGDKEKVTPALLEAGDAQLLRAPKYSPATTTNSAPFLNTVGVLGIKRPLDQMRSRLLDRQYDFLLHPGPWEPNLKGETNNDLPELLQQWIGHQRPVTILDLSGIPSAVLVRLVGTILQIIYEGLFWGREKSEGGIQRPLLVVMEEAHRYVSKESGGAARDMVQRIVKEGRKFGVGAMIISQRPSEVDETILSQCGTFIALRMSNSADRNKVQAALPDSLTGLMETLPVLRTGEAIVTGEAARLPIRCRITLPAEDRRPNSEDPEVAKNWQLERRQESYERVVASWRAQNPRWAANSIERTPIAQRETSQMERIPASSSAIQSVGYDESTQTLEIEFKNGTIYQYYNVPSVVYDQLMQAGSMGEFHAANIKGQFSYSRV